MKYKKKFIKKKKTSSRRKNISNRKRSKKTSNRKRSKRLSHRRVLKGGMDAEQMNEEEKLMVEEEKEMINYMKNMKKMEDKIQLLEEKVTELRGKLDQVRGERDAEIGHRRAMEKIQSVADWMARNDSMGQLSGKRMSPSALAAQHVGNYVSKSQPPEKRIRPRALIARARAQTLRRK